MAKKILIVSSSLRGGSNSEILAHEAEKDAISGSAAVARELNLIISRTNKRLSHFYGKIYKSFRFALM